MNAVSLLLTGAGYSWGGRPQKKSWENNMDDLDPISEYECYRLRRAILTASAIMLPFWIIVGLALWK